MVKNVMLMEMICMWSQSYFKIFCQMKNWELLIYYNFWSIWIVSLTHMWLIVYLTILVTVASTERSFSKLKLLKTYFRSTMLQERLNGLTLIPIEHDMLEKVQYEDLISDFVSKNMLEE